MNFHIFPMSRWNLKNISIKIFKLITQSVTNVTLRKLISTRYCNSRIPNLINITIFFLNSTNNIHLLKWIWLLMLHITNYFQNNHKNMKKSCLSKTSSYKMISLSFQSIFSLLHSSQCNWVVPPIFWKPHFSNFPIIRNFFPVPLICVNKPL